MNEKLQTTPLTVDCFGKLATVNSIYARFEPVAMLQDGAWIRLDEPRKRFQRAGGIQVPRNGLNGHGAQPAPGSFWFLPRDASGSGEDRAAADTPIRAMPVIDLSHLSIADVRRRVLKEGVRLPDHQMRQAVVLIGNGRYARFKFDRSGGHWIAKLPADNVVEIRAVDPSWDIYHHNDDFGYFPFESESTSPGELVDWTSDREFLTKVVERYRSAVEGYVGLGSKSTDDPAKRLQKALTDARLTGDDSRINEAALKRLREELPSLLQGLDALGELGILLLNSDAGRDHMRRAVEAKTTSMTSDIEAQVRQELDQGLRAGRDELDALKGQLRNLRDEAATLGASVEHLRLASEEQTRLRDAVAAELSDRQRAMRSASERLAATEQARTDAELRLEQVEAKQSEAKQGLLELKSEMERVARGFFDAEEAANLTGDDRTAFLGRRINELIGHSSAVEDAAPMPTPPWTFPQVTEPSTIDLAELPARIAAEAEFHGLRASDVRLLDAALRSGELVLLVGASSELAITAIARAASGGHVRNHVLDPSAIGLDDLWRVPGSHRPTVFAMAWSRAVREPRSTVLVCLRNIDAAPFRLWLRSLRAALASPGRPPNLAVLATTVGRTSDDDDFPDASELRQDLVALKVRFAENCHQCDFALGFAPGPSTALSADSRSREPQVSAPPAELRQSNHEPGTILRTLRLRALVGEPLASTVVLSWAAYLTSGRLDDLQEPLREAYAELKSLRLQH